MPFLPKLVGVSDCGSIAAKHLASTELTHHSLRSTVMVVSRSLKANGEKVFEGLDNNMLVFGNFNFEDAVFFIDHLVCHRIVIERVWHGCLTDTVDHVRAIGTHFQDVVSNFNSGAFNERVVEAGLGADFRS